MNRYPPFGGGGRGDFLGYHYGGPSAYGWTVFALQLVIVLGIVWLLASVVLGGRLSRRRPAVAAGPPAGVGTGDDPLAVLRMRYAKGEIDRDQYLQANADLGVADENERQQPPPAAA